MGISLLSGQNRDEACPAVPKKRRSTYALMVSGQQLVPPVYAFLRSVIGS
jgi:hypothetical protein